MGKGRVPPSKTRKKTLGALVCYTTSPVLLTPGGFAPSSEFYRTFVNEENISVSVAYKMETN